MKYKKLFIGLGIAAVVILAIELVLYTITGAFGRTAFASLFGDDPELKKTKTEVVWPERGKILDCKGRVIATNRTVWDVHLDCTVLDAPDEEWIYSCVISIFLYTFATYFEAHRRGNLRC